MELLKGAKLRHSMDEKWRVSRVELLEGGLLYGFVLYDQRGRPSASFGYSDIGYIRAGVLQECPDV
jgi:hypothetical protein